MLGVLALAALFWGLARWLGAPGRVTAAALGLLWMAVMAVNLTLPTGAPLREATGGDARPWLVLAGVAGLVWGYLQVLKRLRGGALAAQAASAPPPPPDPRGAPFTEAELNRYARHILLRELGGPGQRRLKDARVLVVGAGGLGSPVLLYLAAAGVGTLGVIDDDTVDASNLQRQILHGEDTLGLPKVFSAQARVAALNPHVTLKPYNRRLTPEIARDLIADYDLVLDGTDNFDTRYLLNRLCAELGKPLIAGAMTQWEGQISVWDPARGAPCFECIFPEPPAPGLVPTCAEAGIVAPLPGVIGSLMALEAVKALTGAGEGLRGRLMIFDALYAESRVIAVKPRPGCAACGTPVAPDR